MLEDYVINEFVAEGRRQVTQDSETIFYGPIDCDAKSLLGQIHFTSGPSIIFGFKKDGTFFTHSSANIWRGLYSDRIIMFVWRKSPPEHHLTVNYYLGKPTTHNWLQEGF